MKNKLPRKMSALIRVGLRDLEAAQKSKYIRIDMETWHKWEPASQKCVVCLAGAVMDQTLKLHKHRSIDPYCFVGDNARALIALNSLRNGNVLEAAEYLRIPIYTLNFNRFITKFRGKGFHFKKAMHKLADDLEKEGY